MAPLAGPVSIPLPAAPPATGRGTRWRRPRRRSGSRRSAPRGPSTSVRTRCRSPRGARTPWPRPASSAPARYRGCLEDIVQKARVAASAQVHAFLGVLPQGDASDEARSLDHDPPAVFQVHVLIERVGLDGTFEGQVSDFDVRHEPGRGVLVTRPEKLRPVGSVLWSVT